MSRSSVVRLGALALLWGSNFLWIRIAVQGLSPVQLVAARMVLGAVVLLGALVVLGRRLPSGLRVWGHLVVAAVVANVVPYLLFAWAEESIPSALAGVLNATTPLLTALTAWAAGLEPRPDPRRATGLALGFVGAVVVLAPWDLQAAFGPLTRQLAAVGAAGSYALAYAYMRRYLTGRGVPPLDLAAGQMVAAAALLALVFPLLGLTEPTLTAPVVGSTLVLGALGTGAAYVLNYQLIEAEGATTASLVIYLLPVVAVTLGVAVLDEPLTGNLVVGAGLVLAGVAITRTPRGATA